MDDNTKKDQIITVKLTRKEKERLEKQAEKYGKNTSEYIRELINRSAQKEEKFFAQAARPIVRRIQTYQNLYEAGIDQEAQKEKIVEEARNLCVLLKS